MNRSFDERISREHFVVRVREVNIDGIWGTHPYNDDMVSFFSTAHIISIHQEVELDPSNPEHAEMIADYEKKTGQKVKPDVGKIPEKKADKKSAELMPIIETSPVSKVDEDLSTGDATFVDIASLERLAESTKRSFDAYDLLGKKRSS
jgi:hypothetical protein